MAKMRHSVSDTAETAIMSRKRIVTDETMIAMRQVWQKFRTDLRKQMLLETRAIASFNACASCGQSSRLKSWCRTAWLMSWVRNNYL